MERMIIILLFIHSGSVGGFSWLSFFFLCRSSFVLHSLWSVPSAFMSLRCCFHLVFCCSVRSSVLLFFCHPLSSSLFSLAFFFFGCRCFYFVFTFFLALFFSHSFLFILASVIHLLGLSVYFLAVLYMFFLNLPILS